MTVRLTSYSQQLLDAALARGVGHTAEEVIERALEAAASSITPLSEEERERQEKAVAAMIAFREDFPATLGPGETIRDLIHEGHKY